MKTTIIISLLAGLSLFYACGGNSSSNDENCIITQVPENELVDITNKVSLDTAITDISNYVKMAKMMYKLSGGHPDSIIRSYTIGKADLLGVLGMTVPKSCPFRYNSCRVYIGLRASIDTILEKKGTLDTLYYYSYKLYMTPVDSLGNDVFYNTNSSIAGKATKNSYVLDLITPCPKTCDTLSPLYTLKKL